jgi:hypothetical protein
VAAPTWADVVAIAPGDAAAFTLLPGPTQAAFLAQATALCNPGAWGALLNFGIVYLAAHFAKLGMMRTGMVTQEALGQMSRSYATPQAVKGSLGLTVYGSEYKRLIGLLPTSLGAVL